MSFLARTIVAAAIFTLGSPLAGAAGLTSPATVYSSSTAVSDQASVAGPNGTASAVWSASDSTTFEILFTQQRNGIWSPPVQLPHSSLNATDPHIAAAPDGSLYVGFVDIGPGGGSFVERRDPRGRWETPIRLQPPGSGPLVAIDANGNATAVWIGVPTSTTQSVYYATRASNAASFSAPVALGRTTGNIDLLNVAYAPTGALALAWNSLDANFNPVGAQTASRAPNGVWSSVAMLDAFAPGTIAQAPSVAVDAAGVTTVVWEAGKPYPGPTRILAGRRIGNAFGAPVTLYSQPASGSAQSVLPLFGSATVRADANGDVLSLWDACVYPCYSSREIAATYFSGKGWSAPTQVGPTGDAPSYPTLGAAADGSIAAASWQDGLLDSNLRVMAALPATGDWSLPVNEALGVDWRDAAFAFGHASVSALFPTFDQVNQIFTMQSLSYFGSGPTVAAGAAFAGNGGFGSLRSVRHARQAQRPNTAARPIAAVRAASTANVAYFPIPTPSSAPVELTNGPDGNVWFTESGSGKIGSITPTGKIMERAIPVPFSAPSGIAAGPDKTIWYTDPGNDTIGSVSLKGALRIFHLSSTQLHLPTQIISGPGSKLWFLEYGQRGALGTITTTGRIDELSTPPSYGSSDLTLGPDGNVWYVGATQPLGIVRYTATGAATVFAPPYSYGSYIASSPKNLLWFNGDKALGRVTPQGKFLPSIPLDTNRRAVGDLTVAADGSVWFIIPRYGAVAALEHRFNDGTIKIYEIDSGSDRPLIAPDGSIYFINTYFGEIGRLKP